MEISGTSLDELLMKLYEELPKSTLRNRGRRGDTRELLGVSLRITKPRARLSRSESRGKIFSALGELLWYLAGSDKLDFIEPYIPAYRDEAENGVVHGAYGPRLLSMRAVDQLQSVADLLQKRSGSRRALIQLFNAEDIASDHKEVPCTTTLQFLLRDGRLHLSATLRSNDAYLGLPHDVFCFTMLQEMMARRLGVELGEYYQYVGSMHVYVDLAGADHTALMANYIAEGYQKTVEMPPMPEGDSFLVVDKLLETEQRIRRGEILSASDVVADPYWADVIRMLQVFWADHEDPRFDQIKAEFADPMFKSYLEGRRSSKPRTPTPTRQAN